MIQINFEKILEDIGLTKVLKDAIKEHTKLNDKQIDNFIKERINQHGQKMNGTLSSFEKYVEKKKKENLTDPEMKNIDEELDKMIKETQNNYKIFEKKNEIK
jgi:uncharacterized protein YggL (DUF469 family)